MDLDRFKHAISPVFYDYLLNPSVDKLKVVKHNVEPVVYAYLINPTVRNLFRIKYVNPLLFKYLKDRGGPMPPKMILLTVKVNDFASYSLENVKVKYNNVEYLTDDKGVVTFDINSNANCILDLSLLHYQDKRVTISASELADKDSYTVEITLDEQNSAVLNITAKDTSANPLNLVKCTYDSEEYVTNRQGFISFKIWDDHDANIFISKEGYVSQEIYVSKREIAESHFIDKIVTMEEIPEGRFNIDIAVEDVNHTKHLLDYQVIFNNDEQHPYTSDTDGRVRIEEIKAGDYPVVIKRKGFTLYTGTLIVSQSNIHRIYLENLIDYYVNVKDKNGSPLDSTVVMERYNGETRTEVVSGEGIEVGDAVFEQIPLDSTIDHNNAYKLIKIEHDGCISQVQPDLELEDNGRLSVQLQCS